MKVSRRRKIARKTRKRRSQKGGVREIKAEFKPPFGTKTYSDLTTVGDLRNKIFGDRSEYADIVYAGKLLVDDNEPLIEGATYHIVSLTKKLKPKELVGYLLNPVNTDTSTINRTYLKFASSPTGGQNYKPYKIAMKIYDDDEKTLFQGLLNTRFGFEIAVVDNTTFYDKNVVDYLLGLFHDRGLMLDSLTVDELYAKRPMDPNFMDFIHIIFGEIQNIPGGPEPLFTTQPNYDHTHGIFFRDLSPALQEIIITLRDTVSVF